MIQCGAIIRKISTSTDGGYLVQFDIPENNKTQIQQLLDLMNTNLILNVEENTN